jgi:hypothetical protein
MLLIPLFLLTTTGCVSKPKAEITLPPMPERQEMPEVHTMSEIATLLNYYEHLVQEWESWGENVAAMVNEGVTEP